MKRQYLLPDPGEGLLGLSSSPGGSPRATSSRSTTCWSRSRPRSRLSTLSPAGTVGALLVAEGTMVEVGTAIVEIDDGGAVEALPRPRVGPNLVGYGASDTVVASRRRGRRRGPWGVRGVGRRRTAARAGRRADECTRHHRARATGTAAHARKGAVGSQLVLASDVGSVKAKPPVRKYAAGSTYGSSAPVPVWQYPPRRRGSRRVPVPTSSPGQDHQRSGLVPAFGGDRGASYAGTSFSGSSWRRVRPDGGVGRLRRGRLPGGG